MTVKTDTFLLPQQTQNETGQERTVGFELEFSGISFRDTVRQVCQALEGKVTEQTAAEAKVQTPSGEFNVEVDWNFLKTTSAEVAQAGPAEAWLQKLSEAAALLVPIEVVCPPLKISALPQLNALVDALQSAGAVGTEETLIAAYGVHINTELPALDAATIHNYLKAFGLLQWWLVEANRVDIARRVSPYIELFEQPYLKLLFSQEPPALDVLIDEYLHYNASRNRALDMLPLFAELDAERVRAKVNDPKIQPRPTFHYRLPNCRIDDPQWQLAHSWNLWCQVEKLANNDAALAELAEAYLAADRPILGVERSAWVAKVGQWIDDHASV